MLTELNKPELLCQPGFLLRRLARFGRVPNGHEVVRLPWGFPFRIHPRETIGRHVWAFGLFDVIVSEALWRLSAPGEVAVDVGANTGHMTSLLSHRLGPAGRLLAFEPHPQVREDLQRHVDEWRITRRCASIDVHPFALANLDGAGELHEPPGFATNRGTARIGCGQPGSRVIPVDQRRLESLLPANIKIGVMKLDVEGGEEEVLKGTEGALASRRIRDIVFEDHGPYPSRAMELLMQFGYEVFSLGLRLTGPIVRRGCNPSSSLRPWDSPSFLATVDPQRASRLLSGWGWHCLRGS